ncbi:MAG: ribosome maturation factor RimM [bacterium]|nr:ribosome maturation factor RimM [bacterium]
MQEKLISIGKITNFHGIAGEVKVGYSKGKEKQLLGEKTFYVKKDGAYKELSLSKIRFHKNVAIIKFKEFSSINDVMDYKGCNVFIPIENLRNNLEEDEFLVDDLVGVDAFDNEDNFVGKVEFIDKQGSSDLLGIKNSEGKEFLVPFVKALVPIVDLDNKKVVINAIEGLLD